MRHISDSIIDDSAGRLRLLTRIVISLLCGALACKLYTGVMWGYLMTMSGGALENNPLLFIASIAVWTVGIAVLCFVDTNLFGVGVPKPVLRCQMFGYCMVVFLAIMTKSPGARGINWNIGAIMDELVPLSPTLVLNVLLFIPIGMMFHRQIQSYIWARALVVAVIVMMEFSQYALSLGVCDIGDVMVNCAGIACGVLLASCAIKCGCTMREEHGRYYIRLVRS